MAPSRRRKLRLSRRLSLAASRALATRASGEPQRGFLHLRRLLKPSEISRAEAEALDGSLAQSAIHFKLSGDEEAEPRRSSIGWLAPPSAARDDDDAVTRAPEWLFARLSGAMRFGARKWPSLCVSRPRSMEYEHIQYAAYEEGEHYQQWHLDGKPKRLATGGTEDQRLLSLVVLLRKCDSGGDFEVLRGSGSDALLRKRVRRLKLKAGDALVFPSKRLWHRVTPVVRGRRSSLVMWASDAAPAGDAAPASDDDSWAAIERKFEAGDADDLHDDFDDISDDLRDDYDDAA
ncbi:hypothetical protein M885DRAFT_247914 [Pelagophyceae sp. CCMP2097]|nr:hypothetical protein M885DRAFT_247914 [Pelagophyceae sp. CCMP2097]|mmetsp:Transcript_1912/g.5711  ORF Transcript_1912/g.5711 Transcript_1912/m.5711 type:complete len:290 (-) Transcript_1912:976-1845(-)